MGEPCARGGQRNPAAAATAARSEWNPLTRVRLSGQRPNEGDGFARIDLLLLMQEHFVKLTGHPTVSATPRRFSP